jgi:hypothetical protein
MDLKNHGCGIVHKINQSSLYLCFAVALSAHAEAYGKLPNTDGRYKRVQA